MFDVQRLLDLPGYEIKHTRHSLTILSVEYPEVCGELLDCLSEVRLTSEDVLRGGGGKSVIVQRMEGTFRKRHWKKRKFDVSESIGPKTVKCETHEVDHFRGFGEEKPGIALEIEWNNKDPFYDRDLGNFTKLHELGVICVGMIITRGESLQKELQEVFARHFKDTATRLPEPLEAMRKKHGPERGGAKAFQSKFGQATTHWSKLIDRLKRGMGNTCPLLLVGIGAERLEGR